MKVKVFSFTQQFIEEAISDWISENNVEIFSITQSQYSVLITVIIIYKEKI